MSRRSSSPTPSACASSARSWSRVFLSALDQTVVGTALPTDHHRPRRQRPLHVGLHRLPADRHDQRPALRQAVRPVRPAAGVPVRHRRVHARLGARRPVAGDVAAGRRARHPGPRRRRDLPARDGDDRRPVLAVRARPLPGPVRRGVRALEPARPGHRRADHRHDRLAVRVLRQHPDRRSWSCSRSGATCPRTTSAATSRRSTTSARRCSRARWCRSSSASPTSSRPTGPTSTVGGLIAVGRASSSRAFVWIESRAAEPIVPLGLFRNRAFAVSVGSVFLATFGFFAAVVFLPRWFQVVGGASATISGYQMLPLLGGLIFSAVGVGPDRGPDRPLPAAAVRGADHDGRRAGDADPAPRRHAAAAAVGVRCS